MPELPGPKEAKSFPVPSDHGLGLDDDESASQATLRTAQPRGAGRGVSTSASSPSDAERPVGAGAQGFPTGGRLGF